MSAAALDGMLRECKIKVKGAMSIAAKLEALMKFMEYSAEKIAEVLATLNQRKKTQTDDTIEEGLLQKKVCEAHLITKLLEEKEIEHEEEKAQKAKQSSKPKTNPCASKKSDGEEKVKPPESQAEKVPWPVHKGSGGDGETPEIPLGCKLRQYTPALQSPYWRGELPPGEVHHGKCTRSRSYVHSAGIGSAKNSSEQAKNAVVAWLWEWYDSSKESSSSADATTSGAASSSGESKKQKKG